jgi:hypothetical protein
MRCLSGRLFTFCVAVCVLWVRSYWVSDTISLHMLRRLNDRPIAPVDENVEYSLSSSGGTVIISRLRGTFGRPMPELQLLPKRVGERHWMWSSGQTNGSQLRGFSSERASFFHAGNLDTFDAWSVPHWLPVAALLVVPCVALFRLWLRMRTTRGACSKCGYDLRATPERCPECGTVPSVKPTA